MLIKRIQDSQQNCNTKMKESGGRKGKRALKRSGIEGYLDRAGAFYLQRYDSSQDNFRRILHRKLARRGIPDDVEQEEISSWVEAAVAKYVALGAIDDFEYALRKARNLHGRGKARGRIVLWLRQKGVPADVASAVLDRIAEGDPDMELRAATLVARRRRIGPFRRPAEGEPAGGDSDQRRRELAIMARAGFPFAVARMVVDADTEDVLELGVR